MAVHIGKNAVSGRVTAVAGRRSWEAGHRAAIAGTGKGTGGSP